MQALDDKDRKIPASLQVGEHLLRAPIRNQRLLDLLASWEPLDEGLPDAEDSPPQTRDEL